jgi:hypothetical protein
MGRASRRKKKKQSTKSKPDKCGPWGFDYGISARAAAIGSPGFSQELTEANVIAVAYGSIYADEVHAVIPFLSLVGRNESPLQEAFKEFNAWADASDGDAVDVTIVFHKSSGYTIIIGPDTQKLVDRTLTHDAVFQPISFQVCWAKPIDTVSEPLKELRTFLDVGIRPFKLSAATYSGLTSPGAAMLDLVRPVRGVRDLLKFSIRFVDEGAEQDKGWQSIARLTRNRKKRARQVKEKPAFPDPQDAFTSRANRLKTIFPVTLWRAETCTNFQSIIEELGKQGIRPWQVRQALCNVLLSREIGTLHFLGISERDWPNVLTERLRRRYEFATGEIHPIKNITIEEIVQQVRFDVIYLLTGYGVKDPPSDLASGQKQLNRLRLLDEPSEQFAH